MSVWHVDLPGGLPLSLNDRRHRMAHAEVTAEWREDAARCVRAAQVPPVGRCEVTLHAWPPDRRRRDRHNLAPTLKAVCDGMVDAGVIPDDTPEHLAADRVELHDPDDPDGPQTPRQWKALRVWRWRLTIVSRAEGAVA